MENEKTITNGQGLAKKSKQKNFIVFFAVLLILLAISYIKFNKNPSPNIERGPKPTSTQESGFLLNENYYECSQKIDGQWVEARIGPTASPGYYFQPSNQADLQRYCRVNAEI